MFVNRDMKILIEKTSENLRDEEKSFKELSTIIIDIIEEEYQDSHQLAQMLWSMREFHAI